MAIKRHASALWKGTGLEGTGSLSAPSKFFDNSPFGFKAPPTQAALQWH